MHRKGYVHRDIKPQNILVSRQPPQYTYAGCRSWKDLFNLFGESLGTTAMPEFGAVKIGDFGISRFTNSDGQASTAGVGTPDYMAPEVRRGKDKYGPQCDAYSFGVMFMKDLNSIEFGPPPEVLQGMSNANAKDLNLSALFRATRHGRSGQNKGPPCGQLVRAGR